MQNDRSSGAHGICTASLKLVHEEFEAFVKNMFGKYLQDYVAVEIHEWPDFGKEDAIPPGP